MSPFTENLKDVGSTPIVRMYGVTKGGNSVCCHVHGFLPYFYIPTPEGFESFHSNSFKSKLEQAVMADLRGNKDLRSTRKIKNNLPNSTFVL